jgi:glycosyltransferase involved in cell wall biosynthesis
MMETSYKVFCANQLKDHFLKYDKYNNKLIFTEQPLLLKLPKINILTKRESKKYDYKIYNLVFTGALLKRYVIPNYMLNLLLNIRKKINFIMHLYVAGNCENILEKYQKLMPKNIVNHGYVNKNNISSIINNSDILINIAELKGIQISSKIFEYMSTGKPIIHFYNNPEDINLKILADYPLCLCLKQDKNLLKDNANKFIKFCIESKGKAIKFEVIEKIFYYATPRYIANMIDNIINF